jgi:hypothetical protein
MGMLQIFMMLGGFLLQALFTPKPKDQWGSRISNINVPPVSPGQVIPRIWGTMKVPAQMIYASELIETMHTHEQGKKGGKSGGKGMFGNTAKSFTFTYSIDGAWGVCIGPIYRINRIWANQKLLYVDPVVSQFEQDAFDAAYQSEATRLIDEEGVTLDYAASSAFVFAWNNLSTDEVTLASPADAVNYIMSHQIDDTAGLFGALLTPDRTNVNSIIGELYSSLNNLNLYEQHINRFDQIELYLGNETQGPNGLLEGYLGVGNVPAYRNCAYFVLTNLQLQDFGNSVPQFTVEIQRTPDGTTTLTQIMTDLCYQSGLTDGQFDAISNVDNTPFPGFAVTANTSARETLLELRKVFPIDAAESGERIVFNMLNTRARQFIRRQDLAGHMDTDPVPPKEEVTIASDYDMPQRINLKFQEPSRIFSPNTLYAARYNTPSVNIEDYDVTIALDRQTAQQAVTNMLSFRMLQKRQYKWTLPRKYVVIEPSDAVRMLNKFDPTIYEQFYVMQVNIGANGLLEVHAMDHFYIDPQLKPTDQVAEDLLAAIGGNTDLPSTSQTVVYMLDLPLLFDNEPDKPGFYAAITGAFYQWQGGSLFVDAAAPQVATAYGLNVVTPTSGSAWTVIAGNQKNIPHGVILNALTPNALPGYWDRESVLTVRMSNGMGLLSASESDLLIQPLNVSTAGGEVFQYANATDLGNGMWRLDTFLRGLRGTEYAIGTHHVAENFVRLTDAISRVFTTAADLFQTDDFRSVSTFADASTAQTFTFTDTGNTVRPYAVQVMSQFRDVGGDVSVTFVPRVRQNGQWLSGAEVTLPTNDAPETYAIDVLDAPNGAVKATYTLTGGAVNLGGTFTYTTAQQTTDLGAPADPVYVAIYQVSSVAGRGHGLGVVL